MRAICARHGVLFIADEVMTGWGRTGTLLACEQAGVVPDILCLSKGLTGGSLPLAVTLATARDLRGASGRPTARKHVLPFVELHRQPDRLRRRQRQSRDLARRAGAASGSPTLARAPGSAADASPRCPASATPASSARSPRSTSAIASSGYLSDDRPAAAAHFPRARRAAPPARQHGLRHAALLHRRGRSRRGSMRRSRTQRSGLGRQAPWDSRSPAQAGAQARGMKRAARLGRELAAWAPAYAGERSRMPAQSAATHDRSAPACA